MDISGHAGYGCWPPGQAVMRTALSGAQLSTFRHQGGDGALSTLPRTWLDRVPAAQPLAMEMEEARRATRLSASCPKGSGRATKRARELGSVGPRQGLSAVSFERPDRVERGSAGTSCGSSRMLPPQRFERTAGDESWCFPLYICDCWCPLADRCIPAPFRIIQGWTHLLLMFGVFFSFWLLGWDIYRLYRYFHGNEEADRNCLPETILGILLMPPCMVYFSRQIRQYDQDLKLKKEQVERQRQELIDDFRETLSSMDGFLCETTQTNLGFAERGFETKRRDFQRFLERARVAFAPGRLTNLENQELMAQLRRFCLSWFGVFGECSIDPVNAPRLIASPLELESCASVPELAELCLHRLKAAEVRFISQRKEQDARMCDDTRGAFQKMTVMGTALASYAWSFSSGGPHDRCCQGISWLSCSCKKPEVDYEAMHDSMAQAGYPKVCTCCCCCHIVFLSRQHVGLIVAFVACLAIVVLELDIGLLDPGEAVVPASGHYFLWPGIIIEFCLLVVLVRFEDIDIVQQLQQECTTLCREKARVEEQHQRMKDFWYQAQALTDLWLYRTVPRLNLYSEVQSFLDDQPALSLIKILERANQSLEGFERRLPEIEAWRVDGTLSEGSKKEFREVISRVCRQRGLDACLSELEGTALPWANAAIVSSSCARGPGPPPGIAGCITGIPSASSFRPASAAASSRSVVAMSSVRTSQR